MKAKDDESGRQRQLQDQQTSRCEVLGSLISTDMSQGAQPRHSFGESSREQLIAIISSVLDMMQDFLSGDRPDDSHSQAQSENEADRKQEV